MKRSQKLVSLALQEYHQETNQHVGEEGSIRSPENEDTDSSSSEAENPTVQVFRSTKEKMARPYQLPQKVQSNINQKEAFMMKALKDDKDLSPHSKAKEAKQKREIQVENEADEDELELLLKKFNDELDEGFLDSDVPSDAESELTEEQTNTLEELGNLYNTWTESPIRQQMIEESKSPAKLDPNLNVCRNLFSADSHLLITEEIISSAVTPQENIEGILCDWSSSSFGLQEVHKVAEEKIAEHPVPDPVIISDTQPTANSPFKIGEVNESHEHSDSYDDDDAVIGYIDEMERWASDANWINAFSPIKNQSSEVTSSTDNPTNKKKKRKNYKHKQHFCIFCKKFVTCFSRHLRGANILQHNKVLLQRELETTETTTEERQEEIQEVLKLIPLLEEYINGETSAERKSQIVVILKGEGYSYHNLSNDELVSGRAPACNSKIESVSLDQYTECPGCKILFRGKTLSRHMRKCKVKKTELDPEYKKLNRKVRVLSKERAATAQKYGLYNSTEASKLLQEKVFPIFQKDAPALIARTDKLICLFGSEIVQNHLEYKELRAVASRMRELGRLVIALREVDPSINCLSDALFPHKFKEIVKATRKMCRYDEQSGSVGVVSLPASLGTSIKLCIALNMCHVIEDESTPQQTALSVQVDATLLKTLFDTRWSFLVSSNAEKSRKQNDTTKKVIIADNNDIKLFTEYLEDQVLSVYNELQCSKNIYENFEKMCKILIALIIIYNRRRAGEAARIKLEYYVNRDLEETNHEVLNALSKSQQEAAKKFSSFQILGKRTRRVPVLVTKHMERAIDRLIELRDEVGISKTNPYLFPKAHNDHPYDGTKILRELRCKIEMRNPSAMTSRGLRTNIATMTGVCNIGAPRKKKLAKSLGHDDKTHESHYDLAPKAVQEGEVGEILFAAAHGELLKQFPPSKSNENMVPEPPARSNENMIPEPPARSNENMIPEPPARSNENMIPEPHTSNTMDLEGVFSNHDDSSNDGIVISHRRAAIIKDSDEDSNLNEPLKEVQEKTSSPSKSESEGPCSDADNDSSADSDNEFLVVKKTKLQTSSVSKKVPRATKSRKLTQNKAIPSTTSSYILKAEKKKTTKKRWSREERKAVKRQLKDCFDNGVNPKRNRCEECIANEPILGSRTWTQVNGLINNWIKGKTQKGYLSDLSD